MEVVQVDFATSAGNHLHEPLRTGLVPVGTQVVAAVAVAVDATASAWRIPDEELAIGRSTVGAVVPVVQALRCTAVDPGEQMEAVGGMREQGRRYAGDSAGALLSSAWK